MKRADSIKEITDTLEWAQSVRRDLERGGVAELYPSEKGCLDRLIDWGDDALEAANAREKYEKENAPECEHYFPPRSMSCVFCGKLFEQDYTDADDPGGPVKVDKYSGGGAAR